MTWAPDGKGGGAFMYGRGSTRRRCDGSLQPVTIKPATPYGPERRQCPICGRVGLATYDTEDGRTLLMAH